MRRLLKHLNKCHCSSESRQRPYRSIKRKRLQLSPLDENDDPAPLVKSLITALVPALVKALKDNNGATEINDDANDKYQNVRSNETE